MIIEKDQSFSFKFTSKPLSFNSLTLNFLSLTGPKYLLFILSGLKLVYVIFVVQSPGVLFIGILANKSVEFGEVYLFTLFCCLASFICSAVYCCA